MDPDDPIETISLAIYGDTDSLRGMKDPKFFQQRAILCPTNEDVNMINDHMLSKLDGKTFVLFIIFFSLYCIHTDSFLKFGYFHQVKK